jgi:hypothetical protein
MPLPNKEQFAKMREANAKSGGTVIIDPGEYKYKIISAEVKRSRNSGDEMLVGRVRITNHPDRPVIKVHVMLEGPASWVWFHFCESCGWDCSSTDEDDMVGLTGLCEVALHEYNGRQSSRVTRWLPSGDGESPKSAKPAPKTAGPASAHRDIPPGKSGVRQPVEEEDEVDNDESMVADEAEDDLDMTPEPAKTKVPMNVYNGVEMTSEEITKLIQSGKSGLIGDALRQWLAVERGEVVEEEKPPVEHQKPVATAAAAKLLKRVKTAQPVADV